MDRKNFTLEHYLGMSPTEWRLFPITGNSEMTKIAGLLAERHGVIADKVYGKTFSKVGKFLQFDEQDLEMVIVPSSGQKVQLTDFFGARWQHRPSIEVYPNQ